ncbi:MAG: TRAP transporter small permease [Spirochaetes bacterium]|nr:TRAP transporter small permease [Spirochaetota bacterium]
MKFIEGLKSIEKIITEILFYFIALLFFFILSLTIILVILRMFNMSIFGGNEAMEFLFIYTTAIGASVSLAKKNHIKITYFVDKLPDLPKIIVNIFSLLSIIFINFIMIMYSISWIKMVGYFESPVLRLPNKFIQISVPIGCSLVILYCIYFIIIDLTEMLQITKRKK